MSGAEEIHVQRLLPATPQTVFDAWTTPAQIVRWWGGGGITCPEAHVDLRTGGNYRIANRLPDGTVNWIFGEFELVDRPRRLRYTWSVGAFDDPPTAGPAPSVVSVDFEAAEGGTSLTIRQRRIPDEMSRTMFEAGWRSCLSQLDDLLAQ